MAESSSSPDKHSPGNPGLLFFCVSNFEDLKLSSCLAVDTSPRSTSKGATNDIHAVLSELVVPIAAMVLGGISPAAFPSYETLSFWLFEPKRVT